MRIYLKVLDDLITWLCVLAGYSVARLLSEKSVIFDDLFFVIMIVSALIIVALRYLREKE